MSVKVLHRGDLRTINNGFCEGELRRWAEFDEADVSPNYLLVAEQAREAAAAAERAADEEATTLALSPLSHQVAAMAMRVSTETVGIAPATP